MGDIYIVAIEDRIVGRFYDEHEAIGTMLTCFMQSGRDCGVYRVNDGIYHLVCERRASN